MEMEMKKIALALAGASVALTGLIATPAAAADFGGHDRGRYEQVQNRGDQNRSYQNHGDQNRGYQQVENRSYQFQNRGYQFQNRGFEGNRFDNRFQARNWERGERFDSRYATDYMVISNPGYYDLGPAPHGYRWVRSGNDAVLVAIASGIIGALVANAF
jgi:Ni/Co efflux regulator RcnB